MNKSFLTTIIIVIVIVIAGGIYFYMMGDSAPSGSSILQGSSEASAVGAQDLALLNQIGDINIDASFFKDKYFISLTDITKEVPEVPMGRQNPFAPVPGVASPFGSGSTAR